jgi:hypothetical protein
LCNPTDITQPPFGAHTGRCLASHDVAPFFRDIANPVNAMITGGRHSAITFAACPNLPIFCI